MESSNHNTTGGLPNINFGDTDTHFVPAADETDDQALAGVLASLGVDNNASVCIYRQGPGGYRDVRYLTECRPDEYSMSRLQDEFGGGVFRIHVRSGGRLLANKEIKIEPRSKAPTSDALLAPVNAQISQLSAIVENLVAAIATQQQAPPQQSRKDWLDEIMLMKELFSSGAPAASRADPFDQVTKLLDLAQTVNKLTGNAPPEPPDGMGVLASAAKELLPVLVAATQNRAAAAAQQSQGGAPALAASPAASPEPASGDEHQPAPQQLQQEQELDMKFFFGLVLSDAKQNVDPEAWAHMIVAKVGEDEIRQMLAPDNWFENLIAYEPKVSQFREWFSDLREIVFELLTEDGGADIPGGTQSGGNDHATAGTANSNVKIDS